jgi:hypothetical protein
MLCELFLYLASIKPFRALSVVTRPKPTTACSGQLALRQKAGVTREAAGARTSLCGVFHQKTQLVIWNGG